MGRVIIVTGGGSGMGRAIAKLFAKNGDTVFVIGRRQQLLQEVAKRYPENIFAISGDLTKPGDISAIRDKIVPKYGIVDVLVNCAGASGHVDPDASPEDALTAWNSVFATNLTSAFLMIHAFRPHLRRPGGRIVNITSIAAFSGSSRAGGEAYAAAKSGIHGLSRTLVRQLAPEGITVNCVAPGFIGETEFFGPRPDEARVKGAIAVTPAGRIGLPDDVAPAVFYLASEEASFVNGEILNVNGGQQFSR